MSERKPITASFWVGGLDSYIPPVSIAKNQYQWAENIVNKGGVLQTRPGHDVIASMAGTIPQGIAVFTPRRSAPRLVVAVDGKVYQAQWPTYNFVQIQGIQFSTSAKKIYFCDCLRQAELKIDGTISVITPTPTLIMQDGETAAALWDGVNARHCKAGAPFYETPIGTWMVWADSRLWLMQDTGVIASNIADPVGWNETTYLAGGRSLQLPDFGTGLVQSSNDGGILAFTKYTTTQIKSYIRNREEWGTTEDFQKVILQSIGCIAGETAVNYLGTPAWKSDYGWISLDVALFSQNTSKLIVLDNEMMRSKSNLSGDRSGACAIDFANMLLLSVPSGSKYNADTWVQDQAVLGNAAKGPTIWSSNWTGTRPVKYAKGRFGGRERLYFLSYDATSKDDTHIHVWEGFKESRKDNGGRISSQVQTGCFAAEDFIKFAYAEIEFVEILGKVDIQVYVFATRGPFYQVADFHYEAEEGSIGSILQPEIENETILQAFKPQSRTGKTEEFAKEGLECHPEFGDKSPGTDKGFGLLIVWQGRCGVREIKWYMQPETVASERGDCEHGDTESKAVNESGDLVTA